MRYDMSKIRKFKCTLCNGTGKRDNAYFENCAIDGDIKEGECKNCPYNTKSLCGAGEIVDCEHCNGKGYLMLNMDLWKEIRNK